jgi:hypothetical protein
MTATKNQCKFIDAILSAGCPCPMNENDKIDYSFYDSVENADKFIKANKHWLSSEFSQIAASSRVRMDEFGGIPNC